MSITLDLLAQRLEILEKQMAAAMMPNNTTDPANPDKKSKKPKKPKKPTNSDGDDEPTKKKRVSGYILFGKAERENVKAELEALVLPDTKVKSTEVMKRIGELWKDLPDAEREEWNAKAKLPPP